MFGKRLRYLRQQKGLKQKELSKILELSERAVGNYETDYRFPSQDILNKIADYFEVSIDYLLGRTDDPSAFVLSGDDLPDELKKLGVEELGVDAEVKKHGLTKKDIEEVIEYIKFKGQSKKEKS